MIKLELITDIKPAVMAYWWTVRNHKQVRQWSRSSIAIPVKEHQRWFTASIRNPLRRLYLVTEGETFVGIARLDHRKTWTELSLAVHPDYQRQGFGRMIVRQLTRNALALHWPTPGAVVNGKNLPSLSLFVRAGYETTAKKWVQFTYRGTP